MTSLSRRALLTAGAAGTAGLLAACGAPAATPAGPSPSITPASPSPSAAPTSATPAGIPWAQLDAALRDGLARPGSAAYAQLRQLPNPRYDDARPLAIATPATEAEVAATVRFAREHAVPVALRSGGHCYAGWSAGDDRLVIDLRSLSGLTWSGTTVTMGPGRHLADVYAGVAARGRAIPGGSCPTVGLGGLTLGGGVGVLTRAYGLTCDHLVGARVVLPDGSVVTASSSEHPDLFWALRGGGGGHTGVVTSLTYATVAAPTIVATYLTWPTAGSLIPAWFNWIGQADPRAWSTLKLLGGGSHPDGMSVGATVTWVGPPSGFDAMLAPILATHPTGRYDHTRGYLETMQAYAGTGAPESFAATSHIAYQPLGSGVDRLDSYVAATPHSLTEAGISIDALGGHVGDLAPADTAFVHRTALATVQYTATYPTGSSPTAASTYVHDLRDRMTPYLGDHAYVNYADASLADPGTAYFGANWPRLQQVRKAYDPDGFFTQPQ